MSSLPERLPRRITQNALLNDIIRIIHLYLKYRMGRSAAAFAYYLLLSFFPLLICIAAVLGSIRLEEQALLTTLTPLIPPQVMETLHIFLEYIRENRSSAMLWAAALLLMSSAAGAFRTVMTAMGDLYGRRRYPGIWHTVMSFLYALLALLIVYLSIVLISTGGWFLRLLDMWLGIGETVAGWQWLRFVLLISAMMLLFCLLYRSVTPQQGRAYPILPGALAAAVALLVSSIVFSAAISATTRYTLVYGSLASVIVLLLWLYLIGSILLFGGLVNLVCYRRRNSP